MPKIGIVFPFSADGRGSIKTADELIKSINDSMEQILLTSKIERPMNPEFGSDLRKITFMHDEYIIKGLAEEYVKDAISRWEPRVEIDSFDVSKNEEFIDIHLFYYIKNSNIGMQSFNMSIPIN